MAFDREDFTERVAQNRSRNEGRELMPLLRVIDGARPVMDALVHDDIWRRYLQIIQGMMEGAEAAKLRALNSLASPATWNHEALIRLKSDAHRAQAMVDAWKLAIELPKAIADGGEKANEIIKRFENEHAATGQPQPQGD